MVNFRVQRLFLTINPFFNINPDVIYNTIDFTHPYYDEKALENQSKLSSIQKNLFRQKLIKKYKSKREALKIKIKDKNLSLEERISYQNKLNDLPRNGSSIRHRNRCEITGRPRGNYRKFGLSRIKLRELSMTGDLPGVVKSSW